jgi:hypothetical protein
MWNDCKGCRPDRQLDVQRSRPLPEDLLAA